MILNKIKIYQNNGSDDERGETGNQAVNGMFQILVKRITFGIITELLSRSGAGRSDCGGCTNGGGGDGHTIDDFGSR